MATVGTVIVTMLANCVVCRASIAEEYTLAVDEECTLRKYEYILGIPTGVSALYSHSAITRTTPSFGPSLARSIQSGYTLYT
jgi:hypothetical protein|eukprot:COSAG01_NODE_5875_length_3974_cov_13.345290_3_plen_82_part_00